MIKNLHFFYIRPILSTGGGCDGNSLECSWLYKTDEELVSRLIQLGHKPQFSEQPPLQQTSKWRKLNINNTHVWLKEPQQCNLFELNTLSRISISKSQITVYLNTKDHGWDFCDSDIKTALYLEKRYFEHQELIANINKRKV